MNRKGLTLIEVLVALGITGIISMLCISIMSLLGTTSLATTENYKNRAASFNNLIYLIGDIQSADDVEIKDSGKTMIITYLDGRTPIEYKIDEGMLKVNGINIFRVNEDESYFDINGRLVEFKLHTQSLETLSKQRETVVSTKIMIRNAIP